MQIETIEIRLDDIELVNTGQDPLRSYPGREDFLHDLLMHVTSYERMTIKQKLRHDKDLNPLDWSSLRGELDEIDHRWLITNSSRVLYYAWDLLRDGDEARDKLFQAYTQEAFPTQQEAEEQFNSLQKRFMDLKNLPPQQEVTPILPDHPPASDDTSTSIFVIKLNGGDRTVSSVEELKAAISPEERFEALSPDDLWSKFTEIGGMSEEELEKLPRAEEGRRAGWYEIPLSKKWHIYLKKEGEQFTFSLYRVQKTK